MNPLRRRRFGRQLGVSLIEALVALAVMAIGMLGLVGVQTTLRTNSDVAKQRSEALRLAQFEVEKWRSFTVLTATGTTPPGYADIASGAASAPGVNTEYLVTRTVTDLPDPRKGKALKVQVSWTDRTNNNTQQVQLSTVVAGIAPELGATLVVGGDGDSGGARPMGRNRGIPITAKDLGNGTSGFIPPGAPGVAWVFNNATGLIRLCTTAVTLTANLDVNSISCGTDYALMVAGYVRYTLAQPPATTADALPAEATLSLAGGPLAVSVIQTTPVALAGTVACYTTAYDSVSLVYYCAVPVLQLTGTTPTWSGSLFFGYPTSNPRFATNTTDNNTGRRRACRYQASGTYSLESRSRGNQNFVITRAGGTGGPYTDLCPSPTIRHQP